MTPVFRNYVVKPLTILLFVLLIASFALWGIGDIFRGDTGPGTVIAVGEEEITEDEFSRTFRREFSRMSQMFNQQLDMQMARDIGIVDQIVNQTVTRALFDQQARDLGLQVSEAEIARDIRGQEAFQGASGGFERMRFEQVLRRAGLSEAGYVDLLRSEINRERLADAVTAGVRAPDTMAEAMYRYENEQRIAEYIVLGEDRLDLEDPTEEELRSFHGDRPDAFMTPPYREVTFLHLSTEEMMAEIDISEDELRAAYEERRGSLGEPARRSVRQVVFNSAEDAREAVERVTNGAEFDTVAREMTNSGPVDLGMNTRGDLLPELAEAAFAQGEEGVVETPVETALGWHVIAVDAVEEGNTPSFEEVRDSIRRDLARSQAIDALVTMANRLDDALAGGQSLEEAARTVGVETQHIPAIDSDGRDRDGNRIEEIPQPRAFVETAFNTEPGEQSVLRETGDGGYFVLRVDGVQPPEQRPFDEVREEVREAYMDEQRSDAMETLRQSLMEDMRGGVPLAEIAERHGVELQTSQPLQRGNNPRAPEAERALTSAVFSVDRGEPATATFQGGLILATPTDIEHADPSEDQQELIQVRGRIGQSMRDDILAQFSQAMREQYPVRVNQARLDSVLERFQ